MLDRYINRHIKIMVSFQSEGVEIPKLDIKRISTWLTEVASGYGKRIGNLTYKFCSDEEIIRVNREFLNHDYYTDIITFDYSIKDKVGADILISLDTVRSNSEAYGVEYDNELNRVIVHGLLHLCGLKDKTPTERESMESAENTALELLKDIN